MGKTVNYRELAAWDLRLTQNNDGTASVEHLQLAALFRIRDELVAMNRKLNALECPNFVEIPRVLREIRRNTTKKKRPTSKPKLRVVA